VFIDRSPVHEAAVDRIEEVAEFGGAEGRLTIVAAHGGDGAG